MLYKCNILVLKINKRPKLFSNYCGDLVPELDQQRFLMGGDFFASVGMLGVLVPCYSLFYVDPWDEADIEEWP
jgi:hypothetical protein